MLVARLKFFFMVARLGSITLAAKCRMPGGGGAFSVTRADARTTVALMHSGIGMSVRPALAHRHVDALVEGGALARWTPPASVPVTTAV
ncbi:hypothetical protein GO998_18555 (plasmid) [Ralstonia syzygii]|uniref:LysR family transcriptional regulator n=1 Tax=Ralstonia syzygii TaxID=28097 RepID=A0ABX7ZK75_9RALS|nr:hypothetical protein GO998_18555 [Ralstonia syzygii]